MCASSHNLVGEALWTNNPPPVSVSLRVDLHRPCTTTRDVLIHSPAPATWWAWKDRPRSHRHTPITATSVLFCVSLFGKVLCSYIHYVILPSMPTGENKCDAPADDHTALGCRQHIAFFYPRLAPIFPTCFLSSGMDPPLLNHLCSNQRNTCESGGSTISTEQLHSTSNSGSRDSTSSCCDPRYSLFRGDAVCDSAVLLVFFHQTTSGVDCTIRYIVFSAYIMFPVANTEARQRRRLNTEHRDGCCAIYILPA